jgi:hypothetical protein
MYGANVLNGTHSNRVQIEASAWLKVMDQLASVVQKLARDRREEARTRIREARAALKLCKVKGIRRASPQVREAQQLVNSVLSLFDEWTGLVDCVFFLAIATRRLHDLISDAQALTKKGLGKVQRVRVSKALESAVDALDAKLDEFEQNLDQN